MKVIISHDVDHLFFKEHYRDTFLIAFLKNLLVDIQNGLPLEIAKKRLDLLKNGRLHNIPEILEFDISFGIKPIFFIATNRGRRLSYKTKDAKRWANWLLKEGACIGLHGIEYQNFEGILMERKLFEIFFNHTPNGVRMHYLKFGSNTLPYLEKAGYIFDSSELGLKKPYKIGNLWEFPISLMDVSLFDRKVWYGKKNFLNLLRKSFRVLEKARENNLEYFVLLFHDFYFSDAFKDRKDWYIAFINHLVQNGFQFVTFREAIADMVSQQT